MKLALSQDGQSFEEYLLKVKKLGPRTAYIYMSYYPHFNPLKLSEDYIYRFITKHKNNSTVRAFIKNYLEFHKIDPSTIKLPKSPSGRKPERVYREISKKEMDQLKAYFYAKGFKQGLIFDLLYQGALRRVEILTIKLNSFNWNKWLDNIEGFCRLIVLGKGNKEREVLINPETAQMIVNYFMKKYNWGTIEEIKDGLNRDVLLFSKASGEPLIEQNVYYYIKKGSRIVLKTRDVRPHELRSYRAIELEKMGVPLNEIKVYLGHSKIATTELYLRKSQERSLDNIEKKIKKSTFLHL